MSYKVDKLCDSCFFKRKDKASNAYAEHILSKNLGLFTIPIINSFIMAKRVVERIMYPDGYVYHVYINGCHEKWSKNKIGDNKPKKCDNCKKLNDIYYHLESDGKFHLNVL